MPLIIKNLWARRTRTLLSAAGIGISVALIIAIFAIAASFKEEFGVASQITQADLAATQRGLASPLGGSIPRSYVDDIAGYEGVERATGFLLATINLPEVSTFTLFGIVPEDKDLYLGGQKIIEGRYIRDRGEIGLGKVAAGDLSLRVGDTLRLRAGEEFKIVGIYRTGNSYLDSGGIVSLEEAQDIAGQQGKVSLIAIYPEQGADRDKLIEQIESEKRFLKVIAPAQLLEDPRANLINAFAWVLSLTAVIMGGIGVINTMTISTWDRISEIGILKAVGWSRFEVLRMILGESLILSLTGFAFGSLLGIGTLWLTTSLPAVQGFIAFSYNGESLLIGLAVALFLGLVGGLFPAYRAFRLSPVEALRNE